jgi:hypothetical protein
MFIYTGGVIPVVYQWVDITRCVNIRFRIAPLFAIKIACCLTRALRGLRREAGFEPATIRGMKTLIHANQLRHVPVPALCDTRLLSNLTAACPVQKALNKTLTKCRRPRRPQKRFELPQVTSQNLSSRRRLPS